MRKRVGSLLLSSFLFTTFLWFLTAKEAHAYIDIGTGTILFQMLLAGLFAGLFTLKLFWHRLVGRMSRILSRLKGVSGSH